MARINLSIVMKEVLWEQCLNKQRSIQLEHSLTAEQKTHGIFKEYVTFLRKTLTSEQMSTIQQFLAPTITEAGMNDDEIAAIIAQAATELGSKVPDAEYLTDPEKLNVDALAKGDVKNGIQESINKRLLTEIAVMTVLALPAIAKLLAEIIEWCKRKFGSSYEQRTPLAIMDVIYGFAKQGKNEKHFVPSKAKVIELCKQSTLLGLKAPIASVYALYEDPEKALSDDVDKAFQAIADALKSGHADGHSDEQSHEIHFDEKGEKPQPADKHVLHVINNLTYSSDAAKGLANTGHSLHEAFLMPIRAILTPIIATTYGIFKKSSWSKAWEKSRRIANGIYIGGMIAYMGLEAVHHFASNSAISKMIEELFGSLDSAISAAKNTIKVGDLTVAALDEFLAASSIAGEV